MWLLQLGFFPHLIKFHGVHTQLRVLSSASNYPRTLKKPSPASRFVKATRVIEVLCVHLWFVHQVPHFVQHILGALQLTVSKHNECLISANSSCIYNVHKKPHSISWFIIFPPRALSWHTYFTKSSQNTFYSHVVSGPLLKRTAIMLKSVSIFQKNKPLHSIVNRCQSVHFLCFTKVVRHAFWKENHIFAEKKMSYNLTEKVATFSEIGLIGSSCLF